MMNPSLTIVRTRVSTNPKHRRPTHLFSAIIAAGLVTVSGSARAVDGCVVLLCLAAPSWRAIPQCVPPISQLFRDLGRGRAFPSCAMAGAGNSSGHQWTGAPGNCPPQYTRVFEGKKGPEYRCDYNGAVSVSVDGAPWSRTWWSTAGTAVTEYSPAAKAKLGSWDTRFDDDYAAWARARSQASTSASSPACATC